MFKNVNLDSQISKTWEKDADGLSDLLDFSDTKFKDLNQRQTYYHF